MPQTCLQELYTMTHCPKYKCFMSQIWIKIYPIDSSIYIEYKIFDGVDYFFHADWLSYCKFFHFLILYNNMNLNLFWSNFTFFVCAFHLFIFVFISSFLGKIFLFRVVVLYSFILWCIIYHSFVILSLYLCKFDEEKLYI